MDNLRKYIRKLVVESLKEVTTSSEKADDIVSNQSMWDIQFDIQDKPAVGKSDQSMWGLKYSSSDESGGDSTEDDNSTEDAS